MLQASYEEGESDAESFAANCELLNTPEDTVEAAVARGQVERAAELMDEQGWNSSRNVLLLYSLAVQKRWRALAEGFLEQAIKDLRGGGRCAERIASWFASDASALSPQSVFRDGGWPAESAVLLLALAFRHPQNRPTYFRAARAMNYNPAFPGLVVSQLLEQG